MSASRKIISASVLIIITLLTAGAVYYSFIHKNKIVNSPWAAIPADAAAIVKINHIYEVIPKLNNESRIWNAFLTIDQLSDINDHLLLLDSLSKQHATLHKDLNLNELWLSIHPISSINVGLVLQVPGLGNLNFRKIIKYLEEVYPQINARKIRLPQNTDYSLYRIESELPYLIIGQGTFILCNDFGLVQKVLHELHNEKGLQNDRNLIEISATAGKKVDANIYIQPSQFQKILDYFLVSRTTGDNLLAKFASWLELDLIINENALLWNGYCLSSEDPKLLVNSLKEQPPGEFTIGEILPASTIQFLWYQNPSPSSQNIALANLKQSSVIDIVEDSLTGSDSIMAKFKGEVAEAICEIYPNTKIFGKYLILEIADSLTNADSLRNCFKADKILDYENYPIYQSGISLNSSEYIKSETGYSNYFTIINNFGVFTNQLTHLIFFIDNCSKETTLDNSMTYKLLSDNIADESNMLYYVSIKYLFKGLRDDFKPEIIRQFQDENSPLGGLSSFAAQFTQVNGKIYNNLIVNYSELKEEGGLSTWKCKVAGEIADKPVLVNQYAGDSIFLLVFDTRFNMYALDSNGSLIWTVKLKELPIGQVHEVVNKENNFRSFLFNTPGYLYLIDANGKVIENYPIIFKIETSGPLSLFRYDARSDYRILLPTVDNKLQNFDLRGFQVEGWKYPVTSAKVTSPPLYIRHSGKDYIVTKDVNGFLNITDRRGSVTINIDRSFVAAQNSKIYLNRTNNKGIFITTNPEGQVVYIAINGRTEKTFFRTFSKDHYFFYFDFDRDGNYDFIYYDNQELVVYNQFKKVIFTYTFRSTIEFPPEMISSGKENRVLTLISKSGQLIYLIDNRGNVQIRPIPVFNENYTLNLEGSRMRYISSAGSAVYQQIIE